MAQQRLEIIADVTIDDSKIKSLQATLKEGLGKVKIDTNLDEVAQQYQKLKGEYNSNVATLKEMNLLIKQGVTLTAEQTESYNKAKSAVGGQRKELHDLKQVLGDVADKADSASKSTIGMSKALNVTSLINATQQVSQAFESIVGVGVKFESDLAAVSAITGITGDGLDTLGAKARDLSLAFGGTASDQLKSFQGILSKLGPQVANTPEALGKLAENVNLLSKASGDDAATSMSAIVDSMLQFGLVTGDSMKDAETSTRIINGLAASAQVGAAEIPQVAQSILAAGVAAKGANQSFEQVNAAIQVLAVGGKVGAEAGTGLRNVFGLLQNASGPAEAAMKKVGTSSKELGELLTTQGLDVALQKLKDGMASLGSQSERNALMFDIFGTENATAAGVLMDNLGKYQEFLTGIKAGNEGVGAAASQAAIRMNTAEAIIDRVQAAISDTFVSISQTLGQAGTALISVSAQVAPMVMTFASLGQIIPTDKITAYADTMLSKLIPAMYIEDELTGKQVRQKGVLNLELIKETITTQARNLAVWAGVPAYEANAMSATAAGTAAASAGWASFTAWAAANSTMLITVGAAVAVGAAFLLLYDNVDSFRNTVNNVWEVIKFGAGQAWIAIKAIGGVILSVGEMALSVLTAPFKIAYTVISSVVGVLAKAVGWLTGGASSAITWQAVMQGIQIAVAGVVRWFNEMKASVEAVTAYIGSWTDTIGNAISSLVNLDFGGMWDSITNGADNAGKASAKAYNDAINESNFDEAKRQLDTVFERQGEIKLKVSAAESLDGLVKQYQDVQSQIISLSEKQKAGLISPDEAKKLDELKLKAQGLADKIGQIAPESRQNFSNIVDGSGQVKEAFDINIQKVNEFKAANDYGSIINQQKDMATKSIGDMATSFEYAQNEAKRLNEEMKKPQKDESAAKKLANDAKEAKEKADQLKNSLVSAFLDANKNGVVTEAMIKKIGDTLYKGDTEAARKMLIAKDLEEAAKAGVLTDAMAEQLAKKYGKNKDYVNGIFNEQKKTTAETEKTKQATQGWGEAVKEISEGQAKVREKVLQAIKDRREGKITEEKYNQAIAEGNAEMAKLNEKSKAATKDTAELVKLQKSGNLEKAIAVKELDKENEKTSEKKKAVKDVYETEKKNYDTWLKDQNTKNELHDAEVNLLRIKAGVIVSENQKRIDEIAANTRTSKLLTEQIEKQEKLLDIAKKEKDADKRVQRTQEATAALDDLKKKAVELQSKNLQLSASIKADKDKTNNEIQKIQTDVLKSQIELKVKLGEIPESELTKFEIQTKIMNMDKTKADLSKMAADWTSNFAMGLDVSGLTLEMNKMKSEIIKAEQSINQDKIKLDDQLNKERLNKIENYYERVRVVAISEAKTTYDKELKLASDNVNLKLIADAKYYDAVRKANQQYLNEVNVGYNILNTMTTAMAKSNDLTLFDKNKLAQAKANKESIDNEKKELVLSLKNNNVTREEYYKKELELKKKYAENKTEIDKLEAEKTNIIWKTLNKSLSAGFAEVYKNYSDKILKSIDKYQTLSDAEIDSHNKAIALRKAADSKMFKDLDLVKKTLNNQALEFDKKETESNQAKEEALKLAYQNTAIAAGTAFAQMVVEGENASKALVRVALAALKALVPVLVAEIFGKETADKSFAGIASAAVLTGLLYGALSVAESAVANLWQGEVRLKGAGTQTSDSIPAMLSVDESVINARATLAYGNEKMLRYINSNKVSFMDYIANSPDVQSELARRGIGGTAELRFEQMQILAQLQFEKENNAALRLQLERSNKELINEIIDMKRVLKSAKLIETRQEFNVTMVNNKVSNVKHAKLHRG